MIKVYTRWRVIFVYKINGMEKTDISSRHIEIPFFSSGFAIFYSVIEKAIKRDIIFPSAEIFIINQHCEGYGIKIGKIRFFWKSRSN